MLEIYVNILAKKQKTVNLPHLFFEQCSCPKKQCSGISVVDQRNRGTSEKQSTVVRRSSGGVTALTKSGLTTPYLKDKRNYYGIDECWRYFIMNENEKVEHVSA